MENNWIKGDKPPTTGEMVVILMEGLTYPDIGRYSQHDKEWIYEGYDKRVKHDFKVAYYHFISSPPQPFKL